MKKNFVLSCLFAFLCISSTESPAQSVMAEKARAFDIVVGEWQVEESTTGQIAYIYCNWEMNQTMTVCKVFTDAEKTMQVGYNITSFDPATGQYFEHDYGPMGFMQAQLTIEENKWTTLGKVETPDGPVSLKIVLNIVNNDLVEGTRYLRTGGEDFKKITDVKLTRIK